MKFNQFVPFALVLLSAGGLATAQKETPQKPEAKPIPAASPIVKSKVKSDLTLSVTGLTAENAVQVKTALEGMKGDLYACGGCKAEFAKAGDCPKCKMPLTVSKEAILGTVTTDPAKNQIVLQTKEGMELKLSALERALQADAVKIDDKKLMLPGNATLVISGATTAEQATTIQTALTEAKLFQSGHAEATPMGVRVHVVADATAPNLARIREVVTKAGPSFKVTDVIWNDWSPAAAG